MDSGFVDSESPFVEAGMLEGAVLEADEEYARSVFAGADFAEVGPGAGLGEAVFAEMRSGAGPAPNFAETGATALGDTDFAEMGLAEADLAGDSQGWLSEALEVESPAAPEFELELLETLQDLPGETGADEIGADEIEYEAELDEATELLAAVYEWSPDEEAGSEVTYPSGERLRIVSAPDGAGEEHHDPNSSGIPLVDTSGANKAKKLSKNFTAGEFARSGRIAYAVARIDPELVRCLQALRDRLGKPVRINSGYRSYLYNIEVYRRNPKKKRKPTLSQHTSGRAVDIRVAGMTGLQIAKAALDVCGCDIGVGIANTYAHIDVRGTFARWTYFGAGTPADRAAIAAVTAYRKERCGGTGREAEFEEGGLFARIREALAGRAWQVAVGLAVQGGLRDRNKLTNLVFFVRHPELKGRPLQPHEGDLAAEWVEIRDRIVQPVLARVAAPASDSAFKRTRGGYARYSGGRLDDRLRALRSAGRLSITDDEIDLLQRMANVESGGYVQAINSWDNMYMSMGFEQLTVGWGSMQELIRDAAAAFRRYGIEVEPTRTYRLGPADRPRQMPAIVGAAAPADLRSLEWAKRFWAAGLDDDVIIAEVERSRRRTAEAKRRMQDKVGNGFLRYYDDSPVLRALLREGWNNRPAYVYAALDRALKHAGQSGGVTTERFLELTSQALIEVYQQNEKDGQGAAKARRLIDKTARLVL
jgi:uncharacterized protein YcbK (DUF882 family)